MFAKSVSRGLVSFSKKAVMVALVLVMMFVAFPRTKSVQAWSYSPVIGTRGNVVLPTINVGDLYMPNGTTQFTLFGNTGPTAYRSPASSGAQIIKASYQVEQWDGYRWGAAATSDLMQGQISSTQNAVQFSAPYLQPTMARGYFRVTYAFDWYTSNGVLLGSTFVISNLATDHFCVTKARLCQSFAGYVRTGGYLTGAW